MAEIKSVDFNVIYSSRHAPIMMHYEYLHEMRQMNAPTRRHASLTAALFYEIIPWTSIKCRTGTVGRI
jgi:hypothetical protein